MAETEGGGGAPWMAFLAGIILVAIAAFGIVAYNGGLQPRETAQLEVNMPDIDLPDPPNVDLPDPPALPPRAEGISPNPPGAP